MQNGILLSKASGVIKFISSTLYSVHRYIHCYKLVIGLLIDITKHDENEMVHPVLYMCIPTFGE